MIRTTRSTVIALTLLATLVTANVARADEEAKTETQTETSAPSAATTGSTSTSPSTSTSTSTSTSPSPRPAAKPATPKPAETKAAAPKTETKAATTETTAATVAPTAAPPPSPEPAPSATPLVLRETADTHALALAPPPASNAAWKVVAFLALAVAGAWAWKKKNEQKKPLETVKSLQVLRRLAVGVRSELLVVDVDGQRLLIGVTPSSMQTLASLPDLDAAAEEMGDALAVSIPAATMSDRLAALVDSSRAITVHPTSTRTTVAPKRTSKRPNKKSAAAQLESDELEGQARGLAKIGQR